MDLRDLVEGLIARDALGVRQWLADSRRANWNWGAVRQPDRLDTLQQAVAAAVVELMAEREGCEPPTWTGSIDAAPESFYLVGAAETLPRLRRLCEEEGPEPLRRRRLFAPPDFLTAA